MNDTDKPKLHQPEQTVLERVETAARLSAKGNEQAKAIRDAERELRKTQVEIDRVVGRLIEDKAIKPNVVYQTPYGGLIVVKDDSFPQATVLLLPVEKAV